MRRRRIIERDEVLPAPAHVRLAVWRDAQRAEDAEPTSWVGTYRAVTDAEQAATLAALRRERARLRARLEAANDVHYARATRALALVEETTEEAVA